MGLRQGHEDGRLASRPRCRGPRVTGSLTYTATRWDSLGTVTAPPWVVLGVLALFTIAGYLLGRWAGLRGPSQWFYVWLAAACLGRFAMSRHVALSGWLFIAGAFGSAACAAGFIRSTLPRRDGFAPP